MNKPICNDLCHGAVGEVYYCRKLLGHTGYHAFETSTVYVHWDDDGVSIFNPECAKMYTIKPEYNEENT